MLLTITTHIILYIVDGKPLQLVKTSVFGTAHKCATLEMYCQCIVLRSFETKYRNRSLLYSPYASTNAMLQYAFG